MKKQFTIIYKRHYLLIFMSGKVFLKQPYINNKIYTLFFVLHILYKLGFLNKIFLSKDVFI